jgi:hypothetical protein
MVLRIQKVPLQGLSSVPVESVLDVYWNVKDNFSELLIHP